MSVIGNNIDYQQNADFDQSSSMASPSQASPANSGAAVPGGATASAGGSGGPKAGGAAGGGGSSAPDMATQVRDVRDFGVELDLILRFLLFVDSHKTPAAGAGPGD